MFELLSTKHTIVVRHKRNDIVLVGVRNLKTLQEENIELFAKKYKNWKLPRLIDVAFEWKKFDELLSLKEFQSDPTVFEGFIVCDSHWNRVKLKSTQYVALAHLKLEKNNNNNNNNVNNLQLLQIVISNEGSEFLSYFPNLREQYQQLSEKFRNLTGFVSDSFENNGLLLLAKNCNEKKALEMIRDITTHPLLRQLLLNVWKCKIDFEKQDRLKFIRKQISTSFSIQEISTMMNASEKAFKQNNKFELLNADLIENEGIVSKKNKNKKKIVENKNSFETNKSENLFDLLQSEM